MKKAQISFEFMALFTALFFIFIALASFFPTSIDRTSSTKGIAQTLVDEIKVQTITASLSSSDFVTEIEIPKRINNAKMRLEIYASPENLLVVKDMSDGEQLARAFMPKIDSVTNPDPSRAINKLIISKDSATNNLSIEIVPES